MSEWVILRAEANNKAEALAFAHNSLNAAMTRDAHSCLKGGSTFLT